MKTTLLFLSVFLSAICYSQITVSDLIKVAQMDRESFEIYAMSLDFKFNRIHEGLEINGLHMQRGNTLLKHYTEYFGESNVATYVTDKEKDVLKWYQELKVLGFELMDTGKAEATEAYKKEYLKMNEKVVIYVDTDFVQMTYSKIPTR